MTPRLALTVAAAALFVLAGFTAFNEWFNGLRLTYLWLGLAAAAFALSVGIPHQRRG